MLCPRRLHWTINGLFWEGNDEILPEQDPFSKHFSLKYHHGNQDLGSITIFGEEKSIALVDRWSNLAEQYSKMKLSYEKNRFAAIHGLASRPAERDNDIYYVGVFQSKLSYCREATKKIACSTYLTGPSWSWVGALGIEWCVA